MLEHDHKQVPAQWLAWLNASQVPSNQAQLISYELPIAGFLTTCVFQNPIPLPIGDPHNVHEYGSDALPYLVVHSPQNQLVGSLLTADCTPSDINLLQLTEDQMRESVHLLVNYGLRLPDPTADASLIADHMCAIYCSNSPDTIMYRYLQEVGYQPEMPLRKHLQFLLTSLQQKV